MFSVIKALVPSSLKRPVKSGFKVIKTQITGSVGVLPDFLVIGAQKCGTTSLYNYLIKHPCIFSAYEKEVGYFDRYYSKGIMWYRSQFPSFLRKYYNKCVRRKAFMTGEASTGYILNPHALKRISRIIPEAKLILLLRNPVDRAYSHYQHTVRRGDESLSFKDAVKKEAERIGDAWQQMLCNENYYNFDIALYAYLHTGIYVDQIKVLMGLFPKEQILILKTEDFEANPPMIFKQVLEFLHMPDWELNDIAKHNAGRYSSKMDSAMREWLVNYFKPHNRRLFEYLGVDFGWDN